ncbi:50S ribosomal protein L2, chloroplastic, partial [Mucuna pruriens]
MAIHLYKTSTPSTRNGAVDSQVKYNPRNHFIYRQHHCDKGYNARRIIITSDGREDGEKKYILHPRGAIIGDTIVSGTEVPIKMGNALPLTDMPLGTAIHNIEITLKKCRQLIRVESKC